MQYYPFILGYHTRDYLWGGDKLIKQWNKKTEAQKIAESWELSVNDKSQSYIINGQFKGKNLKEIIELFPEIMGNNKNIDFPVLIKLINAESPLSVQVHPGDNFAYEYENQPGKCEMWYICQAEPNGEIYLGLNKNLTKEQIKQSIDNNTIEEHLNLVKVKKGDVYLVPQGTMHAIRGGVTILEIQQNSDVTYRVYDYDRKDASGNKRELHIEKALMVTDYNKFVVPEQNNVNYIDYDGYKTRELIRCRYFVTNEYVIQNALELGNEKSFLAFTVIEGEGSVGEYKIQKGNTVFLPSGYKANIKGQMTIITVNM